MSDKESKSTSQKTKQPNVLFITVDQMRFPDFSDGGQGMIQPLKEIFGFTELSEDNQYTDFFPGFMRLRKNAVSLQNHHIAASACVPSRATIYTGQYGTRTHVMETDSLFKFGSDPNFPWLHPRGVPTTGDWFRAAGYDTHYFGKWDLSYVDNPGPNKGDINEWGFSDWKLSSPDAQGGQLNQLGVYRDGGYADLACDFLNRKAMNVADTPDESKPWFATVSIVNPHDIASAYPINWWMPDLKQAAKDKLTEEDREGLEKLLEALAKDGHSISAGHGVQTLDEGSEYDDPNSPKPVPEKGSVSNPLPGGTAQIELNETGFGTDEDLFSNPDSLHEDLSSKPDCQFDYSYKMGLALKSRRPENFREWQTLPFQEYADQGDAELTDEWFQAYGQFYAYLHTLADREIDRVLKTLDDSGLAEDTIVVFLSDHGEYGGTHGGMIEKWHTAYDQILRVPVVFSNPSVNAEEDQMQYVDKFTSHIDILPTLLGFTNYDSYDKQDDLGKSIGSNDDQTYMPLPGANIVPTLKDPTTPIYFPQNVEVDASTTDMERSEILFITDDTITDHLAGEAQSQAYKNYVEVVEQYEQKYKVGLAPASIVQPNHIRCIKWKIQDSDNETLNGTNWKLARYWDPSGAEPDQWEFYYMDQDTAELNNLVTWSDSLPVLAVDRIPSDWGLSPDDVQQALNESGTRLSFLEKQYLEPIEPQEETFV